MIYLIDMISMINSPECKTAVIKNQKNQKNHSTEKRKEKKKAERDSPMHSPWKSAAQLRQLTEAHGKN